ncbi:hypothetical protein [Flammeovirga sp. SubArs3]|uniref:hypothetical protein n=1 Tax=Flammeovirga sp. SubArs3 TaxID=2995316 RepID=UPI00248C7362|nr:hypothetical protein [Flammeovirga sp. SubArs3]
MRKTNKRIYGKNIKSEAAELVGKSIDIVMKNDRCYKGVVTKVSEDAYYLKDGLDGKHSLKYEDIDEVIVIIDAPY